MRHYNPVLHGSSRAWADRTRHYKSGGGGTSTGTTTTANIPAYMEEDQKALYNIAQQQVFEIDADNNIVGFKPFVPYSGNPADYVAGFSPMQEQSFYGAANLQVPGQFGQATEFANAAGMGAINSAQQAFDYGSQGQQSGLMGQQIGGQGGQLFGGMGAAYGQAAGNLAGDAQGYGAQGAGYGDIAAQIGQMGLEAQRTGQGITAQSQALAAQQAGAGGNFARQATDQAAINAYMSPFMQNVIENQKFAANRDFDIQRTQRQANAARTGAFGGSRQAIQEAEAERSLNAQLQAIEATGLQSAYDKAIQSMQFGSSLDLQGLGGAQSGLGTALQGGQLGLSGIGTALQGLQGGMQGAGVGLSGINSANQAFQTGIQGAGMGLQGVDRQLAGTAQGMQGAQVGLQGVSGAQAGYGLANQAAANLADIGKQQLGAQRDIIGTQNTLGAQQQQQQQNITNQAVANYATAQGFPQEQINFLSGTLTGQRTPGAVTQQFMAAPNAAGTLANLGTAALGAKAAGIFGAKEGGIVKLARGGQVQGYASGGGITGLENVERIANKLSAPQLEQAIQNRSVPEYIGIPLLAQKQQEQQRMQMAQAAMQGQAPQQSIKDQIMSQGQGQGLDTLPSNLPAEGMAGGGIVAFADGGDVQRFDKGGLSFDFTPTPFDTSMQKELLAQTLNQATGQRFTDEEIIATQRAREEKAGIKDIFTPESERLEKEIGGLGDKRKEAFGLAMMQGAFESLAKGDPNFARSIGATGAGTMKAVTPLLQELKASERDMRKQQLALNTALQQFKQAQLSGDDAKIEKARNRYESALNKVQDTQNENVKLKNTAGLKGEELRVTQQGRMQLQGLEGAQALERAKINAESMNKQTDLLAKQYGFSNRVEDQRADYISKNLTANDKIYLAMNPNTLRGKTLDAYLNALANKKALEKQAETMFKNLPNMENNLENLIAPKMPGSPTGRVKFLGFEDIDTPKGR